MKKFMFFLLPFLLIGVIEAKGTSGRGEKSDASMKSASLYLDMASILIKQQKFEEAAQAYKDYLEADPNADKAYYQDVIDILLRDDKPVKIANLGSNVNSSAGEYFPRVSPDGKTLYFTGYDRTGGYGGEDTWVSKKQSDGSWGKAYNFGPQFNTETHEDILAIAYDESYAIAFGNYEGSFGGGDLFYIVKKGERWTIPCNLGGSINSSKWETQANLGPDGKTLLFVASGRSDIVGASDIYITQLTENGWTKPLNLGKIINTSQNEYYPFLAADGKTLYFASNGHGGLGGLDLFYSKRLGDGWTEWSKPVNLGKYINTPGDEIDFSIPASGDVAYYVKEAGEGHQGETDIYYFELPDDMRPEKVYTIYGKVSDEEGKPVPAIIHFFDKTTGKEIATATSSSFDGNYSTTLPYGIEYFISIDMRGFLFLSDQLNLKGAKDESGRKDFTLQKIQVGLKFELKNIYFDSGKATLKDESRVELDKLFDILTRSAIVIELGGHTDSDGSDEANEKLSQDRVNSVKQYLVNKGVPSDRINAVGYGEKFPIADNSTPEGKAQNRRVEVKVTQIIPEKEGGEVVTEEPTKEQKKEDAKFDILAALRYAADIGGLPSGSPCTNEAYFFADKPLYKKSPKVNYDDIDFGPSNEILGGFSLHLLNFGTSADDFSFTGAGLHFDMGEGDEFFMHYYFSVPENVAWGAGLGLNYFWNFYDLIGHDISLLYGIDANFWQNDIKIGSTVINDDVQLYMDIPVGLRYKHELAGFTLGYDVVYNIEGLKSETLTPSASYLRLGVNARWGMFQGGLFINTGDLVDYMGFRLGVTF